MVVGVAETKSEEVEEALEEASAEDETLLGSELLNDDELAGSEAVTEEEGEEVVSLLDELSGAEVESLTVLRTRTESPWFKSR